jgi:hypothetical protein
LKNNRTVLIFTSASTSALSELLISENSLSKLSAASAAEKVTKEEMIHQISTLYKKVKKAFLNN